MKRDELELLALADHRVVLTGIFLSKQGDFIEALGRLGLDTTDAYDLLYEFERMQVRLLATVFSFDRSWNRRLGRRPRKWRPTIPASKPEFRQ